MSKKTLFATIIAYVKQKVFQITTYPVHKAKEEEEETVNSDRLLGTIYDLDCGPVSASVIAGGLDHGGCYQTKDPDS